MVVGGAEVRTVIGHKVRVQGHGQGVLFHGRFQFKDVIVLDGVLEHFSKAHDKVVRWWLRLGSRSVG